MNRSETTKGTLPAGKYWIGDLCYVMHALWNDVCSAIFAGKSLHGGCNEGLINVKETVLWQHSTYDGDGWYAVHNNTLKSAHTPKNGFDVDSGLIGIVPAELLAKYANKLDQPELGMSVTFVAPVECTYEDGTYTFVCVTQEGREEFVVCSKPLPDLEMDEDQEGGEDHV